MTITIETKELRGRHAYIINKNGRHYKVSGNIYNTGHDAMIDACEYVKKATKDHKEFVYS